MLDRLKQVRAGVLDVGYVEVGTGHSQAVLLLHGWPYDIHSFEEVANRTPLPPAAELQWWYQYYFATARGRAGYDANRREFAKLIWRTASPHWNFDDATFERSATAFDNPDHVAIAIDNFRWRLGLTPGEAPFDQIEAQLAAFPSITVPTITLEGNANGAPHPEPHAYEQKFSGKYAHRLITGGIGHNLPQEAPDAFVDAVVDVDAFAS